MLLVKTLLYKHGNKTKQRSRRYCPSHTFAHPPGGPASWTGLKKGSGLVLIVEKEEMQCSEQTQINFVAEWPCGVMYVACCLLLSL